jgi:hypothetical protein
MTKNKIALISNDEEELFEHISSLIEESRKFYYAYAFSSDGQTKSVP